jgi:tight adherence protein C
VLAVEYRDARMFRAEEKAARLPALMTVPMILFILPTLFIVLMGPAALGIIDTFDRSGSHGPRHVTVVTHSDNDSGTPPRPADVTEAPTDNGSGAQKPGSSAAALPPASLTPAQQVIAVGEPLVVNVDARALADNYNLRVIVVPLNTPDSVIDPKAFFVNAKDAAATELRVTVTARSAGPSEVRLYSVPHFGTDYTVAARMPIMVTPAP